MTKNPLANAFAALLYVVVVSSVMFYGSQNARPEDSVFAPIAMLSLLTLSAVVMGYIFFYQPVQIYLDGEKKMALDIFLKTLIYFAVITAVILTLFFSGIFR